MLRQSPLPYFSSPRRNNLLNQFKEHISSKKSKTWMKEAFGILLHLISRKKRSIDLINDTTLAWLLLLNLYADFRRGKRKLNA